MTTIAMLLAEAGVDGLTPEQLLETAKVRIRETYNTNLLERELARLSDRIERSGSRIRMRDAVAKALDTPTQVAEHISEPGTGARKPLRIVALDVETTAEPDPDSPTYVRRTLYQIAAQRLGPDNAWVTQQQYYVAYLALPDEKLPLVRDDHLREQVAKARPRTRVLSDFYEYIESADVLVAYNGIGVDFDVLTDALSQEGLTLPRRLQPVDALLLATSLYELSPGGSLSLLPLVQRLGWTGESHWHDAGFDAEILAWLLYKMAADVYTFPVEVQALLVAVAGDLPAWRTLRALAPHLPDVVAHTDEMVRAAVLSGLAGRAGVRTVEGVSPSPPDVRPLLPASIRDPNDPDAVDLDAFLQAMQGAKAEVRPGQRQMASILRTWARGQRSGLLEAPTGVGKSYALQTTALEWLHAHPDNRVIISTYTKALQRQLWSDIAKLDARAVPNILTSSDVVKGKANRLSLRALLFALEDLSSGTVPAARVRARALANDMRYRELVAYLLLRFIATPALPSDGWLTRSVDVSDIHPFLSEYLGQRRLAFYLKHLSQALAGEMPADSADFLSGQTTTVRETLSACRLAIVNHSLLFANLDDVAEFGSRTLLLLDEAHMLESAATEALSATIDYPALEAVLADLDRWVDDQPAALTDLRATRDQVLDWLSSGILRRTADRAFGALPVEHGPRAFGRKLVIASPLDGTIAGRDIPSLRSELARAAKLTWAAYAVVRDSPPNRSRIEAERRRTLEARLHEIAGNLNKITNAIEDVARSRDANAIVWADEILPTADQRRFQTADDFRFGVTAAPIELARHTEFRKFTQDTFAVIAYVSATLKLTNCFEFIRERLGLSDRGAVAEAEVASSFSFADQALLVAMSDFPSWQEQREAAWRTVAQQVHRFELEVGRPGRNGAMVMTTARATAAAIGRELARLRAADGSDYAIHDQIIQGTVQSVTAFGGQAHEQPAQAGVLVGTKGLWQGVDVADEQVLRMIWINKLPFASPAEPLIAARTACIARRLREADDTLDADPMAAEEEASRRYYLPLAAIELRQAVGRLIRSDRHRGVVVISDRKLDGPDRWRRRNREFFLGSLDRGLLVDDPDTGEGNGAGNVVTMAEAWRRIWSFFAEGRDPILDSATLARLATGAALDEHTQLPEVRRIRELRFSPEEWQEEVADGTAENALIERCTAVARELRRDPTFNLRDKQEQAIRAIARREDLLALLPTSYGKSYVFQLPALVLPGVTIVVSPLVALMTDQAAGLNRSIGGAVRALVAPMRESNSRAGKQEVIDQLRGKDRGIKLVYLSPERLATVQFRGPLRDGVRDGHVRMIVLDEAHTFIAWGDDFRPAFRRAANLLRELGVGGAHIVGLTATAKQSVRQGLLQRIWGCPEDAPGSSVQIVQAPPTRANLALYARDITEGQQKSALLDELASAFLTLGGHAIVYTLTVKEATQIANRLRLLVGERAKWRVELFHGRLAPHEKARIMDKFKEAPHFGDEDFEPLIIVATGAFGLGVDRDDIRAVLVASPPADLAGLFQQVGRAGRNRNSTAWGLMLASERSLGTIEFMSRRRAGEPLIQQIIARLLAADAEYGLDLDQLAAELAQEACDGRQVLRGEESFDELVTEIRTLTVRILAGLDEAGVVEDLGDWPDTVRIASGSLEGQTEETCEEVRAILASATSSTRQPLAMLWRALGNRYADAGELIMALLDLHATGALEVSQHTKDRYLTGIRRTGATPPEDLPARIYQSTASTELQELRRFFPDRGCRHAAFAAYFGADQPTDVCLNRNIRCDCCWRLYQGDENPPDLHRVFTLANPAGQLSHHLKELERLQLDDAIMATLRRIPNGLSRRYLRAALVGKEIVYRPGGPPGRLWHPIPSLPAFGAFAGLTKREFDIAVDRLVAQGRLYDSPVPLADGAGWSEYKVLRDGVHAPSGSRS